VAITSWLRAPRFELGSFVVTTGREDVLVPAGAMYAGSLPIATTLLRPGESAELLYRGHRVIVSGYDEYAGDHPFRAARVLVPSPSGVFVARAEDPGTWFDDVALASWRPCVAYLAIVMAVAIPGLVAAL
jgi:hypothetical protein